ncbi:MAG: hypothetical protein ACREQ5_19185, partial [Candidatus Dormibacteria bacterium]
MPPEGMFASHEPGGDLAGTEAEDQQMRGLGFTREVNYIGLAGNLTGVNSIAEWLAYDASIGMEQFINIKFAITDPGGVLTGNSLVNVGGAGAGNLGSACPATNNQQIIQCIVSNFGSSPAFAGFYIYDEPGCPDQSIGDCTGGPAQGLVNYQNIDTLAAYIQSIDPGTAIIGINTPGGIPQGGWGSSFTQPQIDNLYSCNNNPPCAGSYPWITDSATPITGADYYPFDGQTTPNGPAPAGSQFPGQSPDDVHYIELALGATFKATYPAEQNVFTPQAFSWFQESGADCPSIAACPYPTTAQMQNERDNALYWA